MFNVVSVTLNSLKKLLLYIVNKMHLKNKYINLQILPKIEMKFVKMIETR